jgi:methylthioribulose-1-phosphate dehydratase
MNQPEKKNDVILFHNWTDQLVQVGRWLDERGWVPATGGNLSYRASATEIAITVSGRHKGELTPDDIMMVDYDGQALDGKKPSAETLLHTGLYKLFPHVHAIIHAHPRASVTYTLVNDGDCVSLFGYELLKALPGVKTHETTVRIPIFDNSQEMRTLQLVIDAWYKNYPDAPPVYLVRGHGLTVGATDVQTARYITEAMEEMFAYELARKERR